MWGGNMTKLCKCGHPKSQHQAYTVWISAIYNRLSGSAGVDRGNCLTCGVKNQFKINAKAVCPHYIPISCVCTEVRKGTTLGDGIFCGCINGCVGFDRRDRGFGNCTPEKCACDQEPHNKNCNGCMTCKVMRIKN